MNTILFVFFHNFFSQHCTPRHNRKSNKTLVCQINSSVSVETASAWLYVLQLMEPHDGGTTAQQRGGASACWVMDRRNYPGSRAKFDLWERGVEDLHLQMALEQGRKDFQWKQIPLCARDVGGKSSHYLAIVRKRVHLLCGSHFWVLGEKFFTSRLATAHILQDNSVSVFSVRLPGCSNAVIHQRGTEGFRQNGEIRREWLT